MSELEQGAIYHLATAEQWALHRSRGAIETPSLAEEGFIHCSYGRQVPGTITKHFAGVGELRALRLDLDGFDVEVVIEDSYGSGQAFPHIYAAIPIGAVAQVVEVTGEAPHRS